MARVNQPTMSFTARPRTGCFLALTEPVPGSKLVLALLIPLLWASVLLLPASGVEPSAVFTSLYSFQRSFQSQGITNGESPAAPLVQGSDGNFYGTTESGGANGWGTVFKISADGALTTLYSFGTLTNADGLPLDGLSPVAALVQGADGNFYGTTSGGGNTAVNGSLGYGTMFKISTNGALTSLYSFSSSKGERPNALVQSSDGYFYGTTYSGGTNNFGTVFKVSATGALTNLYSFTGGDDGGNPVAALVQGSDGNFYGTTGSGGQDTNGTIFKISTNGALTSLFSFTNGFPELVQGLAPSGLVTGTDGSLYGTIGAGGMTAAGAVFKITTNGALTTLYSFTGGDNGAFPNGLVPCIIQNFG